MTFEDRHPGLKGRTFVVWEDRLIPEPNEPHVYKKIYAKTDDVDATQLDKQRVRELLDKLSCGFIPDDYGVNGLSKDDGELIIEILRKELGL
jgi:hypothetical protein